MEWEELWKASDVITTQLIDSSRYLNKPIDLRHPYIFYLGHLPAFLDIQLARVLHESTLPPHHFPEIFERGIDPNMEDPSQCHPHSKVPENWPTASEILSYRDAVRARARIIINQPSNSKRVKRALHMCYEHEAMHIETLLYMLMQDEPNHLSVLPKPIFHPISGQIPSSRFVKMEGGSLNMGRNDYEAGDFNPEHPLNFGWDNESPSHTAHVAPFEIQSRPVAVGEYLQFLMAKNWQEDLIPSSWILVNGTYFVRSIYGPLSMQVTSLWPVAVSIYQATEYASFHGCQLPTEEQIVFARTKMGSSLGDNLGFSSFCPKNVIVDSKEGQVTDLNGSGWECTQTKFHPFDGFEQSQLYPGYSSDFFDDKHYVILGSSWATVPKIGNRTTFRNWYQFKYPYTFTKFRLVRK